MKAPKVPASKEKEPLTLSNEEVVEAFKRLYLGWRLASLSLSLTSEVAAKGSFSVVEVCFHLILCKVSLVGFLWSFVATFSLWLGLQVHPRFGAAHLKQLVVSF